MTLPEGSAYRPGGQASPPQPTSGARIGAYVGEALSWLPSARAAAPAPDPARASRAARRTADLREYARRLLAEHYEVEAVADGEAALAAARARRPDLIVSDVMMPKLDGFGLLRALRADAALANVPVVLLSARAGEEARLEGLARGADGYLVKPFSPRELLVHAGALIQSAEARNKANEALRDSDRRKGVHRHAVARAAQPARADPQRRDALKGRAARPGWTREGARHPRPRSTHTIRTGATCSTSRAAARARSRSQRSARSADVDQVGRRRTSGTPATASGSSCR